MKTLLLRWLVLTFAVLVASQLVNGIRYDGLTALAIAALVLGLINALIKPALLIFSLPILMFSFGLFILVINTCLLYFTSWLVKGFHVDGWWAAFWGSLIISIITTLFNPRRPPTASPEPPAPQNFNRPSDKVIDV